MPKTSSATPSPTLRVAVVQARSGLDPATNLARLKPWLERAGAVGCDLILLPENGLCHGPLRRIAREVRSEREWLRLLAPIATAVGVPIAWGGLPLRHAGNVFDSALVTGADGRRLARYDKRHLFVFTDRAGRDVDESTLYTPGSRPTDVLLRGWRCRIGICFDLRFPEHFRAAPRADLLLCPAAFTRETGRAHWEVLLRARAIENQAYVAAANQCTAARPGCPATFGHSLVVDPWGAPLGQIAAGEGCVICELRKAELREVRRRVPMGR
jgi:nitrilase